LSYRYYSNGLFFNDDENEREYLTKCVKQKKFRIKLTKKV